MPVPTRTANITVTKVTTCGVSRHKVWWHQGTRLYAAIIESPGAVPTAGAEITVTTRNNTIIDWKQV